MRFSSSLRRAAVTLAGMAAAATMIAPAAQAAPNPLSAGLGSAANPVINVGSAEQSLRDAAWNARNGLHGMAAGLPPHLADQARGAVDGAVEGLFPGLIAERSMVLVPVETPAPAAPAPGNHIDSPCPPAAKACIDLNGNRTWLQNNGNVFYGPVVMSAGAPTPETATPRGTFRVVRKVKDEISIPFNNAPMPYAVYFTNQGHAIHEGRVDWLSHGCIHLGHQDAVTYFNSLNNGDIVFIY